MEKINWKKIIHYENVILFMKILNIHNNFINYYGYIYNKYSSCENLYKKNTSILSNLE